MPTRQIAIKRVKIFGNGGGENHGTVKQFVVVGLRRINTSATNTKWRPMQECPACNIYIKTAPGKVVENGARKTT